MIKIVLTYFVLLAGIGFESVSTIPVGPGEPAWLGSHPDFRSALVAVCHAQKSLLRYDTCVKAEPGFEFLDPHD